MLTFVLCETCGKHGRFTGTPEDIPLEVASKSAAYAILEAAAGNGALPQAGIMRVAQHIMRSGLADVEEARDLDLKDGTETFVEENLREQIETWNEAAAATNRPDLFGRSDFHEYVNRLRPQPS